ncbi:hypothetical protein Cylst_1234 [Cylindrospermum stagnale PCC 7417]|uniref:Glutathione S-transferase n=1 Tax=Cylindrospermum stagnale PCC 7417 TaxID=56107 RepID=K9WUR1_9NOST|nr:hypothetical protein [Cylindrospermum stagnale]AFZ23531.1 hypothetical protein Cylst_1234 [Cylindrospermum stagnale PCC 7417]
MKRIRFFVLSVSMIILVGLGSHLGAAVRALPTPEDTPEEILRTEIITEARSPINGDRLTAAEYAQLRSQLQNSPPPKLNTNVREQIFLLRLRKTLLQFFPFLNF